MTLLRVEALDKRYGGIHAVRGVSLDVSAGELVALIGPNGAGKSTTFGMVGGQIKPTAGRVALGGKDVTGLPPQRMARLGVGRTFQVAAAFASMTVARNIQVALAAHRGKSRALWPNAGRLFREGALAILEQVGIADLADKSCSVLAYGDVKRAELAIALAGSPRLLLMDEPMAGMAPQERSALMAMIARLARESGIGVLFTEHDMEAVFTHADRILVLVRGAVIAAGSPREVRSDPEVRRAYLGEIGTAAAGRIVRP